MGKDPDPEIIKQHRPNRMLYLLHSPGGSTIQSRQNFEFSDRF